MAEGILIPLGGMVLSGWIIYTMVAGIQNWHRRRTQAISQAKMLDKSGSVSQLGTFLNTDIASLVILPMPTTSSRKRFCGCCAQTSRAMKITGGITCSVSPAISSRIDGDIASSSKAPR